MARNVGFAAFLEEVIWYLIKIDYKKTTATYIPVVFLFCIRSIIPKCMVYDNHNEASLSLPDRLQISVR